MNTTSTICKTLNVLLAEDSVTQARLVKTAFDGIDELQLLAVVENGNQALEYLRREGKYSDALPPDLLLLDINMPRMDGFEVLDEIKADPNLRRIPVVMLTTSSEHEDITRAYEAGASAFITKPNDFRGLEQVFEIFARYWTSVAHLPPK